MKERKGIKINLTKITKDKKEEIYDLVAREIPFSIFLNEKKIVTLNCTPENYKYLGIRFSLYLGNFAKKRRD